MEIIAGQSYDIRFDTATGVPSMKASTTRKARVKKVDRVGRGASVMFSVLGEHRLMRQSDFEKFIVPPKGDTVAAPRKIAAPKPVTSVKSTPRNRAAKPGKPRSASPLKGRKVSVE